MIGWTGWTAERDDYLVKPFHIRELMARVRALTRRPQQIRETAELSYGDLHFDYPNRKVTCNGHELVLTAKEAELLSVLMKQPETAFSREQLVLKVWGSNADIEPGNVDNYISFLRKRLRELHSRCEIKTFTAPDIDWRNQMLKRLQNRLRIFLIVIFMAVVSLILCFSFWNTWQARQIADITYVQRMASLIIYQLEADPARPDELLTNYEREMHVYSILKDSAGNILHQSDPDTLTDLDTLGKIAEESIEIQSPANQTNSFPITEQGGYGEITGTNHDRYYVIPASISTKSGNWYSLVLFYEQPSISTLTFRGRPRHTAVSGFWLLYVFSLSAGSCCAGLLNRPNGCCKVKKTLLPPPPMN